ncbi:unnamed protein product, partial [Rotaria sp. Silwood2]
FVREIKHGYKALQ